MGGLVNPWASELGGPSISDADGDLRRPFPRVPIRPWLEGHPGFCGALCAFAKRRVPVGSTGAIRDSSLNRFLSAAHSDQEKAEGN